MPISDPLSEQIIGCAYRVANTLGHGFLEKLYENALLHEIRKTGLSAESQQPIQVHYDGVLIGSYAADILVEEQIIIELKAVRSLEDLHTAQCFNYLKATGLETCLLINFGTPRIQIRRFTPPH